MPADCDLFDVANREQRLAEELKRAFGFEGDLPAERSELLELLPLWLTLACETAPVTILIDGLDHLRT